MADPPGHTDEPDRYLGRWRGRRPARRRLLLIGAVVAALGAAVVIPLALPPGPASDPDAGAATRDGHTGGPPAVASAAASPSSEPDPSPSASPSASRSPSPSASQSTPRSVSYEAEAPQNLLGGSASVSAWPGASGGRIVLNLGEWGPSAKKQGTLAFSGVTVPADGKYTLRLYSVDTDGEPTRTAVISVSGAAPITATMVSGPTCCAAKTVEVGLSKGANTITFAGANGRAPSLDRIVISIP